MQMLDYLCENFDALVSTDSMEIPKSVSSKRNYFERFETGWLC